MKRALIGLMLLSACRANLTTPVGGSEIKFSPCPKGTMQMEAYATKKNDIIAVCLGDEGRFLGLVPLSK